jgi:hypothetical protein
VASSGRQFRDRNSNIQLIIDTANKHGVDPILLLATAQVESNFNAGAVGDNGTSFGLFQNHVGGAGGPDVASARQFLSPNRSVGNAARRFSRHSGGASPGEIAYGVQRPANREDYISKVNAAYNKLNKRYGSRAGSDRVVSSGVRTQAPTISTQLVPSFNQIETPTSRFDASLVPTLSGQLGQPLQPVNLQGPRTQVQTRVEPTMTQQTVVDPGVKLGAGTSHAKLAEKSGLSMISGFRPGSTIANTDDPDDHSKGKAWDYSGDFNTMNNFANNMRGARNIKYIIFNNRIASEQQNWAWRPYSHPGGVNTPTARHEDHVHISEF